MIQERQEVPLDELPPSLGHGFFPPGKPTRLLQVSDLIKSSSAKIDAQFPPSGGHSSTRGEEFEPSSALKRAMDSRSAMVSPENRFSFLM
jgi:hypothetical protein